jgi:hypothetical protein
MYHNQYQELFDRQKRTFASGVTRTYDWRWLLLKHLFRRLWPQLDTGESPRG